MQDLPPARFDSPQILVVNRQGRMPRSEAIHLVATSASPRDRAEIECDPLVRCVQWRSAIFIKVNS